MKPFTNHNEDAMVAKNKAEQVTQDDSLKAFTPTGKEDEYYRHQAPTVATERVEKKVTYGAPAGGISSAPTSHVVPESEVTTNDKGDGSTPYVGGQSYMDNTGTAADGFMPRQGGEIPAKPYPHKSDDEKIADNVKQNEAKKGIYGDTQNETDPFAANKLDVNDGKYNPADDSSIKESKTVEDTKDAIKKSKK